MGEFHKVITHLDPSYNGAHQKGPNLHIAHSLWQCPGNNIRITPHHVVPTYAADNGLETAASSSSNMNETQQPPIHTNWPQIDNISNFVNMFNIFPSSHRFFNVEVIKPPEEQWDDVARYGSPISIEYAYFSLNETHADIVLFLPGNEYIVNSEGLSGLLFSITGTTHNPGVWPKYLTVKIHQCLNAPQMRRDPYVPIEQVNPFKAKLVPVSGFQSCSKWPARFFHLIYETQVNSTAAQLPGCGNLTLFFCLHMRQVARWDILTAFPQPVIICFESPLQYHTSRQMDFSGVRIQDIIFINAFSSLVLMVSAGLRQTRSKFNRPFYLILNVLSDCEADAIVKIFIGPSMNENIVEAREHLIEVDSFHYHLVAGMNEIVRLPFNSIQKAQALVDAIDRKQVTNRSFLLFAHVGRFPTLPMQIAPRNYYRDTYYPEGYPLDKTIMFEWLYYRANSFLGRINFIRI